MWRVASTAPAPWREVELCGRIKAVTVAAVAKGAADKSRAWDAAWREVYALAAAICDRVMGEWTASGSGGGNGGGGVTQTARRAKL